MRVLNGAACVLLAVTLTGCSATTEDTSAPSSAPSSTPSTTYEPEPPRKVRPDEVPLNREPVKEGETEFSLIGLSTHMKRLVGSHIEFEAKGEFTRVRLVIVNVGRGGVLFDTQRQLLVLEDGGTVAPDRSTMMTKRQPDKVDLGAGVRMEFDLYYDAPAGAEPAALRVFGGPTLADGKDEEGTDIPLEPAP